MALSTDTAKARDPAGISSTAMMLMTSTRAVEKARATVWLTPSAARFGASAPVAVTTQPATADHSSTRRRPRRSASATITAASSAPTRTAASITPTWRVGDAELLLEEGVGLGQQRAEVAGQRGEHAEQRQRRRGAGA